jgi:hypothetical protein
VADEWTGERLEEYAKSVLDAPRMREFPYLGGWAIVVAPLDRFESRTMLWAFLRAMYEFHNDELVELRARRFEDEDGTMRTWWVTAIRPAGVRRRRKPRAAI